MFKNTSLSIRIISSFISVVLAVSLIGWGGVSRLNYHIQVLGYNTVPSLSGLGKVNEGQTRILASERRLVDPLLTEDERQESLTQIKQAWEQIDEGLKQYNEADKTDYESQKYQEFLPIWENWKAIHEKYLQVEDEYHKNGIINPWEKQAEFLTTPSKNIKNDEKIALENAFKSRNKIEEIAKEKRIIFNQSRQSILEILRINEELSEQVKKDAFRDVNQITILMLVALVAGPILALIIGQFLSRGITKPIFNSINMIASSSAQIAAALEEQERILAQQSASVNETTVAIDQLGASASQATQQAKSAAENASQMFKLSQEGTEIVSKTQQGILNLQHQVEGISEQIFSLNNQIGQIDTITNLVSNLANQTNMLALNASVEAVRAGEAGKGFAVVATEIRKLADGSRNSAEKISFLLSEIQREISSTVMTTDQGKKNADLGIQLSQQTTEAFQTIANAIHDIMIINQQMALTATQQANAMEQVVSAMNSINQGSKESVLGISQTRNSIEQLNDVAKNLQRLSGS